MTVDSVQLPPLLRVAMALATIESAALIILVIGRDGQLAGAKLFLVGGLAMKLFFVWRLGKLSAGAVFAVLLFELSALLVALVGPDINGVIRVALAGTALAVVAGLFASMHAFPSPEPPRPTSSTIE